MIMEKYTIRRLQLIYSNGCRDKINLTKPIRTNDKESVRAKLVMKYTTAGMRCVGVNLDYDEFNEDEL